MKVNKIVFFNTIQDADAYLMKVGSRVPEDCLLVALTPSVRAHLKKKGIAAQDTASYFTNDSHKELLEKTKNAVDWMRTKAAFADLGLGVRRAYGDAFVYCTRRVITYCLWVTEVVSHAVAAHRADVLVAARSGARPVASLYVEPDERYVGEIVYEIALAKGLGFEEISEGGGRRAMRPWTRALGRLRFRSCASFIVRYVRFRLWALGIQAQSAFTRKRPAFYTTRLYQMDRLAGRIQGEYEGGRLRLLRSSAIPSFPIPHGLLRALFPKFAEAIISQKKVLELIEREMCGNAELFSHKGISYGRLVSQKIRNNLADHVIGMNVWTIALGRFIDAIRPRSILSNGTRDDDVIIAELCREKKIPAVLISHGSHIRPKNEYETIEWGEHGRLLLRGPFSHFVLQTPVSEGYLETFPTSGSIVKTGPLIWGKPINRERSKALFTTMFGTYKEVKIIVHAGTPKPNNALRFYVYETSDEYIRAVCDLADVAAKVPNTILIVKFRPTADISVEGMQALVPFRDNVRLSVGEPFLDVLGMADLLVSFSSTTIEEALQNRIPVLLYGGDGRYQHISAQVIEPGSDVRPSAVYQSRKKEDLEYALRSIVQLNIDGRNRDRHLFEPYIYPESARRPLADALTRA